MEKEKLIEIFNSSETIAEICRKLYGKNNGGMHNRVLKLFNEFNYDWKAHLIEVENKKKKYCLNCGKEILGKERSKKKFCNHSCAAQYNNKIKSHLSEATKSAISEGLKKYNNSLTDELKWEKYCKRFNIKLSFEEYIEKIKKSRKKRQNIKGLKKEQHYCMMCGKEIHNNNTTFCSNDCRKKFENKQYEEYIERWKNGEECGHTPCFKIHKYVRRYLFEKYNNSCQKCGWNKENPYSQAHPNRHFPRSSWKRRGRSLPCHKDPSKQRKLICRQGRASGIFHQMNW